MTYHLWKPMKIGSKGPDVLRLQQLLSGANRFAFHARPGPVDGVFGQQTADAVRRMKWFLGYPLSSITGACGEKLRGFMVVRGMGAYTPLSPTYAIRKRARAGHPYPVQIGDRYPLAVHGRLIGYPYQGTHDHPSTSDPMHNWESCNAIDILATIGTRVLSSIDGVIGPQWGPLDSTDPHLMGLRIHVAGPAQELYLAHLSKLTARPGQHVTVGGLLGYSGSANGVQHLHFATMHGDPARLIGEPPSPGYRDRNYPG